MRDPKTNRQLWPWFELRCGWCRAKIFCPEPDPTLCTLCKTGECHWTKNVILKADPRRDEMIVQMQRLTQYQENELVLETALTLVCQELIRVKDPNTQYTARQAAEFAKNQARKLLEKKRGPSNP